MAGVAVLQPQDVLKQRVSYRRSYVQPTRSRRNSSSNPVPNPNSNPRNNNNNNRRKRGPPKSGSANLSTSSPAKHNHLVMGEVKILKRGEALTNTVSFSKENVMVSGGVVEEDLVLSTTDWLGPDVMVSGGVVEDLVLSTTDRLGPEPHMVSNQMSIADFYAGSAFFTSPPPSSVPLPAFFKKKNENNGDATSDLIRLLRLDLE